MTEFDLAQCFKALSDVTRLSIVQLLKGGELCACKILEKFNISQPTLSYHMKLLVDCDLVIARKNGIWNYYFVNYALLLEMSEYLSKE